MAEHLGQHGTACFGPSGGMYSPGLIIGIGGFLQLIFLLALLAFRNPQFYWLRPDHGKRACITCGWWTGAVGDPYDLSRVYEEFGLRAQIGQEMADKECSEAKHKGYVDPHVGSKFTLYGKNGEFTVHGEGGDIINTTEDSDEEEMQICAEVKEIQDETNR